MVKVSVIIPTYGKPVFLEKSIDSVCKQTMSDWELIIVDDNDPDTIARNQTEVIVKSFISDDQRIKYIKHDHNRNGAVARNTGFAIAEGQYIALLDSDDEYLPERLRVCCDVLDNASEVIAGVYTGCEYRKGGKVFNRVTLVPSGNFLTETLACKFHFSTGSNIFVRKCVVDELHGFDPLFLRHQDYEFLVRVFEKYDLIGIPDILVIKNNENWNLPNVDKLIAIKKQYLMKFQSVISKLNKAQQDYVFFWQNISLAEASMAQKRYRLANSFYREAHRYGSFSIKIWFRRLVYPFFIAIKHR